MLLVRSPLVGVARRHGDAVDAELGHRIEKGGDARRVRIVEERAVDRDAKTLRFGGLQRRNRPIIDSRLADGLVVHLLVAIEMNRPREIGARRVLIDLLLKQQRIGAYNRELLARDDPLDDLRQLLVQKRLAASHDDHRARRIRRPSLERVRDRNPLVENSVGIVDLAAARASQIAPEQRLQHQHERIALAPREMLRGRYRRQL